MGRRALSEIQGNWDVTTCLKARDELKESFDPLSFFSRVAPLELEIGSGKGLFIRNAAASHPNHNFLGIEVSYRYALISAIGLCKRGLSNAVMLNEDAAKVLAESIKDDSLEAVHVYFPDPWWKKAHRKRRILRADVLTLIEKRLRPGGTLHFQTDVEEYYLSSLKLIAQTTSLSGPLPVEEQQAADDMDYLTHFERRTRLNELPVYRCRFVKPEV
ncbi:MAG: tRNA (guanosine(46)-N7)-methyltransferase TrmB [Thermoguttaceae bacterium]|nr:tRNA (guanosine(46)-N7)-methyltransferase TrmB [Thermoguttaceae bacterium]